MDESIGMAIDQPSYKLGMITAFVEMVAAGVKKLGLSPPLDPEELSCNLNGPCELTPVARDMRDVGFPSTLSGREILESRRSTARTRRSVSVQSATSRCLPCDLRYRSALLVPCLSDLDQS